MKKLSAIKRSNDNRYFVSKDGSVSFYLNLAELDYETPINLSEGFYAQRIGYFLYEDCGNEFETINNLIEKGELVEKKVVEEYDVILEDFVSCSDCPSALPYDKVIDEFVEHGFNVTKEALKHNFDAWSLDSKSGFRDEENGYFLFTPCGCNTLYFNATKLDKNFDWQETYGAVFD